jgi:hypothetical protein
MNAHIRCGKQFRVRAKQPRSMTLWARDLTQVLEFCAARGITPKRVEEMPVVALLRRQAE